jgi:hypothetical protein
MWDKNIHILIPWDRFFLSRFQATRQTGDRTQNIISLSIVKKKTFSLKHKFIFSQVEFFF